MVFCAQCGTPGDGRFCTECGARLNNDSGAAKIEPPSYNPYAGESTAGSAGGTGGGSTPAPRSNIRNVAGSSIASGTSAGGTSAPGTSAGGTSAAAYQTVSAGFVNHPAASAAAPYQQQESPTALFGSQGYRLEAFFHITREIFVALDRTTQPVGTQMIEASKMRRFRELGGKSIPPFYETHVLPLYYQTIGAQCVGANVLSWDGWNTFLAHKILSAPDDMFATLGAVLRGLGLQLPWPLARADFPAYAYPDAAARELQFQQGVRDLAGAAMGGGGQRSAVGGANRGSNVAMGLAKRSLMSGLLGNSGLFN
ncbi:hypothetical protein B0H17DRAFT_1197907 [Mycena rosella]|uniref:Uncharacterized protein n=1 Tax=Mycena rosella TaxID=1033263 RepID=A0AAD7DPV3_MYCRO|nr:hypothetical protein B0H17DRAFT_1197907 [Mycena rosella]